MRIFIFILFTFLNANSSIAQQKNDHLLFDVIMHGFLFKTSNGVFFQPIRFMDKVSFINSFDKNSFQLLPNNNLDIVNIMDKVGHRIIVKKYFQDSLDKSGNHNRDTVFFFRCDIKGSFIYDSQRTIISSPGFGFVLNDSLYEFGNLSFDNRVDWIRPKEEKYRVALADNYKKKFGWVPTWLKKSNIIIQIPVSDKPSNVPR